MSVSKYDNDFKALVLEKKIDRLVAREKKKAYFNSVGWQYEDYDNGVVVPVMLNGIYYDFIDYCKEVPQLDCAMRLNESKKERVVKYEKR